MISIALAIALAVSTPALAEPHSASARLPAVPAVDPVGLYGDAIEFDVTRKGDRVGFHRVKFTQEGASTLVSSTFQLQIDLWIFTAFKYLYTSEARWVDGRLRSLSATVDDGGTLSSVDVRPDGDRLMIANGAATYSALPPLYPTNHWNASVLQQKKVLNTLTGHLNSVDIQPRGREAVTTERGVISATRYAYTGDLDTEVWYDDDGRWVKMRFVGRDGSAIEYVCRKCQGGLTKNAQR